MGRRGSAKTRLQIRMQNEFASTRTYCYSVTTVPGMAILAIVSTITVDRIPPLISRLHAGARGGPTQ